MKSLKYIIRIDTEAEKAFKKLSGRDREYVAERIKSLAVNPRPDGVKKLKGMRDLYRVRARNYRIVYRIFDSEITILVVNIAKREDAYRNLRNK